MFMLVLTVWQLMAQCLLFFIENKINGLVLGISIYCKTDDDDDDDDPAPSSTSHRPTVF